MASLCEQGSGRQNSLISMVETPLLASAFPTVRYEAKLPAEDYHDPDDPWSLEIPWEKQKHEEEKAQRLEREKETSKGEKDGKAVVGEDDEVKMEGVERREPVDEVAAIGEEQPLTVPEPAELTGFGISGGICEPLSSDNSLSAARGKDSIVPGSHVDQETINTVVDTGTSLVDDQVSYVLKENHVDIEHHVSIMPDKIVTSISAPEELPDSTTLISGNPEASVHSRSDIADKMKPQSTHLDQVEVVQRSGGFTELPLDNGSLLSVPDVCEQQVHNDQVVKNVQELILDGVNDFEVPEEGAILQDQQTSPLPDEQSTGSKIGTTVSFDLIFLEMANFQFRKSLRGILEMLHKLLVSVLIPYCIG